MSFGLLMKLLPVLLLAVMLAACSSSEELNETGQQQNQADDSFRQVDREEPIIPETDEPVTLEAVEDEDVPPVEKPVPIRPAMTEEPVSTPPARQEAQQTPPPPPPAAAPRAGSMMWSVQLGAFKSEAGAFQLVEELKQKFNQPVYKRYDPATGYYKVTLGSFPTREVASEYKLEVQARGYPDSFIVEVAR
ncbi:MAG: SPOR domain-containing protein [Bacteroidetes bacterium]|nr:SPOR domain-containing protein [Bacteroidota bacterium]